MKSWITRQQSLFITVGLIIGFASGGLWWMARSSASPSDGWQTDFTTTRVPLTDMLPIGERDGMIPIDQPMWQSVSEADWLMDNSPVIALTLTDPARAYPLAVLIHHGVVNDTIGDLVVAVTFCPLCNSPIIYNRRVGDRVLRFGTTGAIYQSGLVMWDDATQSWWQQFTGEALVGVYAGTHLTIISSQLVGFAAFGARYPNGVVLRGDAALPPVSYGRNPYIGYDTSPQPLLFSDTPDTRLTATERVMGAVMNGQPMAYPFRVLSAAGVLNDEVGGWPLVAFWQPGAASALDQGDIDESRDVGMAALFNPVVEGRTLLFKQHAGLITDLQTGSTWDIFGEATHGPLRGTLLMPYNAQPVFWFAWAANYPDTDVYTIMP